MKTYLRAILSVSTLLIVFGLASCKKYLDRPLDANISEQDVFTNFRSFQGFTEELYHCLPDMSKSTWNNEWNMGDDILSTTNAQYRLGAEFDNGNYRAWQTGGGGWDNSWLDDGGPNTSNDPHRKGLWPLSWYGIRKANLGLANLDKLVTATQDEKNVLRGQLLFFRGFFHFQLMSFWGGLPYIDTVLSSTAKLELPRLTYRETALRAAKDFEDAAALLPINWDSSPVGDLTKGLNQQRVTSSVALAYKGKDLLYAASPMMNQLTTGGNTYDQELCKQAAEAFSRVLKLSETGASQYKLLPWDRYSENVFTISPNGKHPGFPEVIFGPPSFSPGNSRWSLVNMFIPPPLGGEAGISSPAANYVNYFGMANGLPIDAAGSGYTTADPWTNRDPRFYKAITYDGVRMIRGTANAAYRFAELFNGGNLRLDNTASRSGYLVRKFVTDGCNSTDNEWNNINIVIPYLRLADVYLMYAEAVVQGYGTPQSSVPTFISAIEAVNKVRARATVPDVDSRYANSKDAFMGELMRERAVELAFEGLRWHDLRRWNVAEQMKYREKTVIDFDRGPNGKPLNLRERVVVTRVFEKKHNWLPLPNNQVNLYPSFGQNEGW
ncbi:RagB/SusD family nutrient uptake outer membrane protein [Segetibacter sp. 3557_3]|uniref:RagB/SusD family nutrient uptake outer membrane protein n=1 Tax=Segetibacter sp. 3557_3 TaxID=2547429 RepID=UPI001058F6DD|nr:RagB/SusD family nutrient uptake outer membrane protein [Segetibacter sp. 3557_3]TDH23463.1 RagB/SusD family nutrient uptake outer membrane protein [Segetibacter sp. 3557_3]